MFIPKTTCSILAVLLPLMVSSATGSLRPSVEAWMQTVQVEREKIDQVAVGQRELAAKKALFQMRLKFPILTDWVLQDAHPSGFQLLVPGVSEQTERRMLQQHGVEDVPGDTESRLSLYASRCEERRQKRLRQVLETWAPFAFTESYSVYATFIGYTEGLSDARFERFFRPGTRLTLLHFDEKSTYGRADHVIEDPQGMMRDVDVSYDLERLLFAWKKSDRLDDYHIYEHDLSGGATRQLTTGLGRADYEPVYLPDGEIVFTSTRPEQSVPCWWNEISNLYRMNGDGDYVRRLAVDQVQAIYPQVMNNGRLTYTRWDYSDRGQVYPHPVFSMDPDGQAQRIYYGGNSWFPTSLLHTRAIPSSSKSMAIAAGHHTQQRGKLVTLDVSQSRDEGKGMAFVAPRRDVPYERVDAAQQHGDQFRYPFPFSESEFLISYVPDWGYEPDVKALQGDASGNNIVKPRKYADLADYGLYWMNVDGEREYLYGAPRLGVQRPVALGHKPAQPVIPETVDYTQEMGTLYVQDVYKGVGLQGIPRGEAKKIRVVRLNYRAAGIGLTQNHGEGGGSMNSTPVSIGNGSWDVKEIIGDADIHPDGSAMFYVPADESIYLQVLNERGQVIQTTRTWDTLRPGEQKGCVGCHDKGNQNYHPFKKENTMAWQQEAQTLKPFYGETRGFSFQHEIQPILNQRCVSCHNGEDEGLMDLRGLPVVGKTQNKRAWSTSYINLTDAKIDKRGGYTTDHPEGGLVTWISKMSRPTELPPYFSGAAKSPLLNMLDAGHHEVQLSDEEQHKLAAWMDLLVPFVGTYREAHDWSEPEMRKYDYYEEKRRLQHKEGLKEISDFMAQMTGTPQTEGQVAAFTLAKYEPVWSSETLPLIEGQELPLGGDKPFVFDHMTLRVESNKQVKILLRSGGETVHTFHFGPGKEFATWNTAGKVLRNQHVTLSADQEVTLTKIEVLGVPETQLPELNGYKPHLHY